MATTAKKSKAEKPVKSISETVKKIVKKVEAKIATKPASAPVTAKKPAKAKPAAKEKVKTAEISPELPMLQEREVLFSYWAMDGAEHNVFLVGDFNGWKPRLHPMRLTGGNNYQAQLMLPPGTYRYKFVVDECWIHDPAAEAQEWNEHGTLNSVVRV